jgi:hypothetical protein
MATIYEDNFGYYDLEADPDEDRLRQEPEQAAEVPALLRAGQVAAGAQDLRAMLRRDGIRRPRQVRPKRGCRPGPALLHSLKLI